jgi:hypothetical protein
VSGPRKFEDKPTSDFVLGIGEYRPQKEAKKPLHFVLFAYVTEIGMPLLPHTHHSSHHGHSQPEEFDDDVPDRALPSAPKELSSDHWQVEKLLKFARTGNPTATTIALCELAGLLEASNGDGTKRTLGAPF